MEILTLLKANIRHRKGTFISIIILMLIIVMSMTAIFSTMDNCRRTVENALLRIDSGDLVVFFFEESFSDELSASIAEHSMVERVTDIPAFYAEKSEVNETNTHEFFLRKLGENYRVFNEQQNAYQDTTEPLSQGEIYVTLGICTYTPCEVGDTLHVTTSFGEYDFVIKGFIEEPVIGASPIGWKQFFISDEDFELMRQDCAAENSETLHGSMHILSIHKSPDCHISDAEWKRQLNLDTGMTDYSIGSMMKAQSINYTLLFIDIISKILLVFITLLFVIVLIVMCHSISTSIEADYVNLGVLKSQGFTKGKIRTIFLLQYLIAEIIGIFSGSILAVPLNRMLGSISQPITAILSETQISMWKSLSCIAVILLFSGIAIILTTRTVGKISPVRALSGGQEEVYFDSRIQMPVFQKGLSASLALRQFTSGKRRYISTILIVSILVFFMMTIMVLGNAADSKSTLESMGYQVTDCDISFSGDIDDTTIEKIEESVAEITPITKKYYRVNYYFSINGEEFSCSIYKNPEVIGGISMGRAPLYDNEIIITEFVAEELDITMGDTVWVSHSDKKEEYIVSGIYQNMNDAGLAFSMSLAGADKLGVHTVSYAGYALSDNSKSQQVSDMLNESFGDILEAEAKTNDIFLDFYQAAINGMTLFIYILSAIFALVVVSMVCAKTFTKEKTDIGIYKALGFTSKDLRLQFAFRFLIVALSGSVLGTILCVLFTGRLLNSMLRLMGITSFAVSYTASTFLVPIVLICVCFFVFAYLVSGKIRRVEIRELVTE